MFLSLLVYRKADQKINKPVQGGRQRGSWLDFRDFYHKQMQKRR